MALWVPRFRGLSRNGLWYDFKTTMLSSIAGFRNFQEQGFECNFLFVLYFQTNATTNVSKAFCAQRKGVCGDNDTDTILKIVSQIF